MPEGKLTKEAVEALKRDAVEAIAFNQRIAMYNSHILIFNNRFFGIEPSVPPHTAAIAAMSYIATFHVHAKHGTLQTPPDPKATRELFLANAAMVYDTIDAYHAETLREQQELKNETDNRPSGA